MEHTDFKTWLGIIEKEKGEGTYSAELELKPHHKNGLGWIHGGVYMSLLDTVMGNAVLTFQKNESWEWGATSDISIQFIRPASGTKIMGEGHVIKAGKHLVFVEGNVTDETGTLVCKAQGTWFVSTGNK